MAPRGTLPLAAAAAALLAAPASGAGLSDTPPVSAGGAPLYLSGEGWAATSAKLGISVPAQVPGDLLTDLERGGAIGDPLYGVNFRDASVWDTSTWVYSRSFDVPPALLAGGGVNLVFDGVKMAADVTLNGAAVGATVDQWLRYSFPVGPLLKPAGNVLTVSFNTSLDPRNSNGRFMACSGGWDWAPLTTTVTTSGATTMTKGIWKDVYLLGVPASAPVVLDHVVPHVFYGGAYPTAPLTDATAGPWTVSVRLHTTATASSSGTFTVAGDWAGAAPVSVPVSLAAGSGVTVVNVTVPAGAVSLWWPNGMGAQPLYTVTVTWAPTGAGGATASTSRRIGFRYFVIVTADDTDPSKIAGLNGSGDLTMRFRVNGASFVWFAGNMIPIEEMEGRQSVETYRRLVASAAEAHFNGLRMWGGGTFLPDGFYDACDEAGLLVYHDMTFAQGNHGPSGSPTEEAEIRHQVRRLSAHPSIAVWDGCNECGGGGLFDSFVMTVVASEDVSRPAWPSCPAQGWSSGVDRLTSFPNGQPMHTAGKSAVVPGRAAASDEVAARVVGACVGSTATCTSYTGLDYAQGVINKTAAAKTAQECCDACAADSTCFAASFVASTATCWFKPDGGKSFTWTDGVTSVFPPGHAAPPLPVRTIEVVNGDSKMDPINTMIPAPLAPPSTALGPAQLGQFTSEFGASAWSSFESTAPSLPPSAWGVQGGAPPDNCTSGFTRQCYGDNAIAQRNYPAGSWIVSYFGSNATDLNATGEAAFRGQLYMAMLGQALEVGAQIEVFRSQNRWGVSEWQLGEIWPTGGWGSLEYGTVGFTGGQVVGGRWKPLHHFLAQHLYAPVVGVCGAGGSCFVRNDNPLAPFAGSWSTSLLHLRTGAVSPLVAAAPVALPVGPAAAAWSCADGAGSPSPSNGKCANDWPAVLTAAGCASDGSDCVVTTRLADASGATVDSTTVLLAAPAALALRPAVVTAVVGAPSPDGRTVNVTVTSDAPALYVTLTTLAQGRFQPNAFTHPGGGAGVTVTFMGWAGPVDAGALADSLAIEHVGKYVHA